MMALWAYHWVTSKGFFKFKSSVTCNTRLHLRKERCTLLHCFVFVLAIDYRDSNIVYKVLYCSFHSKFLQCICWV